LSDLLNVHIINSESENVMLVKDGNINAKDAKDYNKNDNSDNKDYNDYENLDSLNPNDAINNFRSMLNYTKADMTMKSMQLMVKFINDICVDIDLN